MSKKKKRQNEAQNQQPDPQAASAPDLSPVQPSQPEPAAAQSPADPAREARDRKYFRIFWSLVVAAVAVAWVLDVSLPNVHEALIERWTMAAFAASLAVLLFIFK